MALLAQVSTIDTPFETIQINPERFCATVARAITNLGGEVRVGHAVVALLWEGNRAVGVRLDNGVELPARAVVMAVGPWTNFARVWIRADKLPPIVTIRSHRVLLSPRASASSASSRSSSSSTSPSSSPAPPSRVLNQHDGDSVTGVSAEERVTQLSAAASATGDGGAGSAVADAACEPEPSSGTASGPVSCKPGVGSGAGSTVPLVTSTALFFRGAAGTHATPTRSP